MAPSLALPQRAATLLRLALWRNVFIALEMVP